MAPKQTKKEKEKTETKASAKPPAAGAAVVEPVPVAQIRPEDTRYFLDRYARYLAEKDTSGTTVQETVASTAGETEPSIISPATTSSGLLASDAKSVIPVFQGRFKPYYVIRTSLENPNLPVYDILFLPEVIDPVTQRPIDVCKTVPLDFPTRGGIQRTRGLYLWTVIKHRTKDPNTKREVPVKVLFATPAMALRTMSPLKILEQVRQEEIVAGTRAIELHEALIIAEDRDNYRREADTAWEVVQRSKVSHFKATSQMLEHADEARTRGDEAMAKAYTEEKDWKEWVKENICVIIILVIIGILILTGGGGGGG